MLMYDRFLQKDSVDFICPMKLQIKSEFTHVFHIDVM